VSAAAEVELSGSPEHVTLKARGATLAAVLDRVARQTGMTITWDPALGRSPVSIEIVDRPQPEVVRQLLESSALNYALRLDASGKRVDMVVILGTGGVSRGERPTPRQPDHGTLESSDPVEVLDRDDATKTQPKTP
jgi:hypothetical protein